MINPDEGCPKCGTKKVVKIVWPFNDSMKKVESGSAVIKYDLGYSWYCKKCDYKW